MLGGLLRRHAHLSRREQSPRRRGERRWATRAIWVATGAESASCALQCEGAEPANSAQVAHGTGHVITCASWHAWAASWHAWAASWHAWAASWNAWAALWHAWVR